MTILTNDAKQIIKELADDQLKPVDNFESENESSESTKASILNCRQIISTKSGVITLGDVETVLSQTIKGDRASKLITFLTLLSTYTKQSQINLAFVAPSSAGKTYNALETARLFPKEDIMSLAYASPKSFFHDVTKEKDKETGAEIVDLRRKILIFLDQPHYELSATLRPLLSHDQPVITVKIADRNLKSGIRARTISILGYPSFVYCSAKMDLDEQEQTRFFLLSPDTDEEKSKASVKEAIKRATNTTNYFSELDKNPLRKKIIEHIHTVKECQVQDIVVPFEKLIFETFQRLLNGKRIQTRHARDITRILSLIKSITLLNINQSASESFIRGETNDLTATEQHVNEAFELWKEISESQLLGLSPFVYDVYKNVFQKLAINKSNGFTRSDVFTAYHTHFKKSLPDQNLRRDLLPALMSAGLIYEEEDPNDKRRKLIFLGEPQGSSELPKTDEKKDFKPSGQSIEANSISDNATLLDQTAIVENFDLPQEVEEL